MLKKLLEQQETYIQELERKNRELKDRQVSPASQTSVGGRPNGPAPMPLLDIELIKRPSISVADKLHYVVDHMQQQNGAFTASHPLVQALIVVKNLVQTEAQQARDDLELRDTQLRQIQETHAK